MAALGAQERLPEPILASLPIFKNGCLNLLALALVVRKDGLAQGILVGKVQEVPALLAEGSLVVTGCTTFATEDGSRSLFFQAQQVPAVVLQRRITSISQLTCEKIGVKISVLQHPKSCSR